MPGMNIGRMYARAFSSQSLSDHAFVPISFAAAFLVSPRSIRRLRRWSPKCLSSKG